MMEPTYEVYGVAFSSDHVFQTPLPSTARTPDLEFSVRNGSFEKLPGLRRLYASPHTNGTGQPNIVLERRGDVDVLQIANAAQFVIEPARIVCHLVEEWYRPAIEMCLLGPVLSLWLERSEVPALHASAVVIHGRAVGFVGTNGSGKSTLATYLVQRGCPLLTDDILPLENRDGMWWGRAGYPQMRMWLEQARRVVKRPESLDLVLPWVEKRKVRVGDGGFGSFYGLPVPLGALYVLDRRLTGDPSDAYVGSVEPTEALATLYGHAFLAPILNVVIPPVERLQRMARVVAEVPVRSFSYPSGYENLPSVRDALLSDIVSLQGGTHGSSRGQD